MQIGDEIYKFAEELWPLNRSLTGEGVRETLLKIGRHLPDMTVQSIPSGTKVFDWTVPQEWHVNKAHIVTPDGVKICNFFENNLHLVGYSKPFRGHMNLAELKQHLFTLPDQPDAIPYHTSYYTERWGFCLSQRQLDGLQEGSYEVVVDTNLFAGELVYGELILPGEEAGEIFLSTYICHPSMANNELSGPTIQTFIARWLMDSTSRRYTYRMVFIPETIGSLVYLSRNLRPMKTRVIGGFNLTCLGDERAYSYLPSRNGGTYSDLVAKHVLSWTDPNYVKHSWLDRGSDERQYCAPGVDLPIASICRTKFREYPEYHTSLDRLGDVVTAKGLDGGYWAIRNAITLIERDRNFKTTVIGEPQMGKRNMYPSLTSKKQNPQTKLMMDFLSLCDGDTSLIDIADRLHTPAWSLYNLIDDLLEKKLIEAS